MITIPVQLSNELARRVIPLQDRLPEIIELGLRQINFFFDCWTNKPRPGIRSLSSRSWTPWPRRASSPCRSRLLNDTRARVTRRSWPADNRPAN